MTVIKSFFIAFSIYSKIPMPQFEWKDKDMEYSLCFFPWVGAVIGLLEYGWIWLAFKLGINSIAVCMTGVAIPLIVSGGFHVDGYMDTMDALHSYQSRERKLEILKDSHVGAFAVIMLVLYYMIYTGAYSMLGDMDCFKVYCLGFYLSRILSGIGVVTLKSAKSDGMLHTFATSASEKAVKIVLVLQLVICVALMLMIQIKTGAVVVAGAGLTYAYYAWKSKKEFGGITGDLAGYFVTLCEAVIVILAAVGGLI